MASRWRSDEVVSTHSRPKAAGSGIWRIPASKMFQHTAARRRLDPRILVLGLLRFVSTHSRPKAAGNERNSKNH